MKYEPLVKEKYEQNILTDVLLHEEGFKITYGSWSFWVPHDKNPNKITPKIGDTTFFYGDGLGRPVLGLQINDALVFFEIREERE